MCVSGCFGYPSYNDRSLAVMSWDKLTRFTNKNLDSLFFIISNQRIHINDYTLISPSVLPLGHKLLFINQHVVAGGFFKLFHNIAANAN